MRRSGWPSVLPDRPPHACERGKSSAVRQEFCTWNTHPGRAPHAVRALEWASTVHAGTPGSPISAPERSSAKTCAPVALTRDGAESVHNLVHNSGARFEPRWHGRHRRGSEKLVEARRCQGTALPPLVALQERPPRPPDLAPSNNSEWLLAELRAAAGRTSGRNPALQTVHVQTI